MMPVLEIERLSIDLPGRDVKRPVLAEVSLRVAPGEIVALVGSPGPSVTSRVLDVSAAGAGHHVSGRRDRGDRR